MMPRRTSVALLLLGLAPGAVAAQSTETEPRTVTVSAQGTIEKEPEQGVILLAVENEAPTARAAAEANAEQMTQLTAALRRAGIPERSIRTVSYQLQPEYVYPTDRSTDQPRIVGYRATNMVQVTVDTVARMGGVIDAAIGSGANRVASISFRLRDPRAAHLEAVEIATRNARREAEVVAAAAGEALGPLLSISTGGYHVPPPMPMYAGRAVMDSAALTPIEGGTLSVTATVNVVYQLVGAR